MDRGAFASLRTRRSCVPAPPHAGTGSRSIRTASGLTSGCSTFQEPPPLFRNLRLSTVWA
eukprot:scaffold88_cov387-Prasinococcus_capsulatus_cf.AAC.13